MLIQDVVALVVLFRNFVICGARGVFLFGDLGKTQVINEQVALQQVGAAFAKLKGEFTGNGRILFILKVEGKFHPFVLDRFTILVVLRVHLETCGFIGDGHVNSCILILFNMRGAHVHAELVIGIGFQAKIGKVISLIGSLTVVDHQQVITNRGVIQHTRVGKDLGSGKGAAFNDHVFGLIGIVSILILLGDGLIQAKVVLVIGHIFKLVLGDNAGHNGVLIGRRVGLGESRGGCRAFLCRSVIKGDSRKLGSCGIFKRNNRFVFFFGELFISKAIKEQGAAELGGRIALGAVIQLKVSIHSGKTGLNRKVVFDPTVVGAGNLVHCHLSVGGSGGEVDLTFCTGHSFRIALQQIIGASFQRSGGTTQSVGSGHIVFGAAECSVL